MRVCTWEREHMYKCFLGAIVERGKVSLNVLLLFRTDRLERKSGKVFKRNNASTRRWETPTQSSKINWPIFLDTQEAVISMILLLMTSSCWRRNDVWCSSSSSNNSNNNTGFNDSTGNNHPSAAATKSRQPSPANFSGLQRNLGTSLSDRLESKKDLFWRETKKLWRSIYLSSQKVEIARNDEKLILCCLDKKI